MRPLEWSNGPGEDLRGSAFHSTSLPFQRPFWPGARGGRSCRSHSPAFSPSSSPPSADSSSTSHCSWSCDTRNCRRSPSICNTSPCIPSANPEQIEHVNFEHRKKRSKRFEWPRRAPRSPGRETWWILAVNTLHVMRICPLSEISNRVERG